MIEVRLKYILSMKKFFLLIILFCSNFIFSQKFETESLVDSFTKDFIPKEFKYYNLLNKSFRADFDVDYLNESIEDSGLKIPFFRKDDFFNSKTEIDWNDYNLEKAYVFSDDKIPKFKNAIYEYILVDKKISQEKFDSIISNKKYNQIVVKVNPNWSKDKQVKECHKELKNQEDQVEKENRDFYSISNPIFSIDKKFAIIYYRDCCHTNGYLYFYSDNKWQQYLEFYKLISN
ncbi:MAG: hypothetical protein BGO86_08265 [Chryseobacterium sp. 36-9]|nr:MAG: hypothetical protein BGO86_08265 [Chryseobacterium sp. 36-9]